MLKEKAVSTGQPNYLMRIN